MEDAVVDQTGTAIWDQSMLPRIVGQVSGIPSASKGALVNQAATVAHAGTLQSEPRAWSAIMAPQGLLTSFSQAGPSSRHTSVANSDPIQTATQTTTAAPRTSIVAIVTSDQLIPPDLAKLQQSDTQIPSNLGIDATLRSKTIVDFFDNLVDANAKIPRLAQMLESGLLEECMNNGSAPFWDDFAALPAEQLMITTKHFEDVVMQETVKQLQGKT